MGKAQKAVFFLNWFLFKKFLFRFYGHYDTFVTIEPKSGKGFFCETMLAISRISYIILQVSRQLAFSDVIQHHEMVLLPMKDGWQRTLPA
ncbi:MAG: hypothetical protein IJA98_05095 [Bacteroidaceae bacterium]|nr:hypothetical protein [Bacteroidaceae bacterium]MBQ3238428.1 hypothetical protein [Bacteroidaceae bacterium]